MPFNFWKNRKKEQKLETALQDYFSVINSYIPVFTTFQGGLYEMELTRAAIHSFATHCSKLKPEVVGSSGKRLENILQSQPNSIMDTKKYLYRLATAYMCDNNAIIAPIIKKGELTGYYPMVVSKIQLIDYNKEIYIRYDMGNGEYFAVELEKCGILNQYQYTNELWGESNRCLQPTLDLINTQNEGIINGIKNSAAIRFIARLAMTLKDKDIKAEQSRLREINLSPDNNGGVMLLDQKYSEIKQIDSHPYIINPAQMNHIRENVFTYFGTNEFILQNKFNADQWNAYYEGKIEPFAIEAGMVHTNMTFSEREKAFGNQIFFSSNRLQYASISDKINFVVQMGDRGRTSINEDREVFNLPPIENGDAHFIRGEYKPINSYEGVDANAVQSANPTVQDNDSADDSTTAGQRTTD